MLLKQKDKKSEDQLLPEVKIQRMDDVVTVVMFSSSIHGTDPTLSNCIIEHYKWEDPGMPPGDAGTEGATAIVRAFNSVLKSFIKLQGGSVVESERKDNVKMLRIVNITSVKPKGTIPRNLVKGVLSYLCSVKDAIDLVYFPGFKSIREAADILPLMYELKESAVAVCETFKTDDVPTKEMLAVRVIKGEFVEGEISGATDVAVDILPSLPLNNTTLIGPCTVLGVAAAFLYKARKANKGKKFKLYAI